MRNPIRLKNLRARFLPLYAAGVAILLLHVPERVALLAALPPIGNRLLGVGVVVAAATSVPNNRRRPAIAIGLGLPVVPLVLLASGLILVFSALRGTKQEPTGL